MLNFVYLTLIFVQCSLWSHSVVLGTVFATEILALELTLCIGWAAGYIDYEYHNHPYAASSP